MKKVTNSAELTQSTEAKALVPKIVEHPVCVDAANIAESVQQALEGLVAFMQSNPDALKTIDSVTLTPVVTVNVEATVKLKN